MGWREKHGHIQPTTLDTHMYNNYPIGATHPLITNTQLPSLSRRSREDLSAGSRVRLEKMDGLQEYALSNAT